MFSFLRQLLATAALLGSALTPPIAAQQRVPTPVPDKQVAAPSPAARPALWRVRDADTTIYLFGTIHALPADVQWFDGPVANAFAGSDELVTEIIEASPEQMQGIVVAHAMLPPGKSLRGLLNHKDRAAFEAAMKANGLPLEAFDRFEPWYAAIALATLPLLRDGYASESGVEARLDARAKAAGTAHGALETAEYQLGLFDALPLTTQVRYLREVVAGMTDIRAQLAEIVAAWRIGDAEKLARLMNEDESDPQLKATLLTNRNRNWAAWLHDRMKRPGTVFVAVGAGHLAGRGSVQDKLKAFGITAARVQ